MSKFLISLLVLVFAVCLVSAQTPRGSSVEKLDPALDSVVSPNARIEILKSDYFGNVEGPLWVKDGQSGYILISDIASNDIYKWTLDGKLSLFLQKTGFSGPDTSVLQAAGYVGGYNGRFYGVAFGS